MRHNREIFWIVVVFLILVVLAIIADGRRGNGYIWNRSYNGYQQVQQPVTPINTTGGYYTSNGTYVTGTKTTTTTTTTSNGTTTTPQGACYVGGCSAQICSDQPNVASTCEYHASYACYQGAKCERQATGQCGWTMTPYLSQCLMTNQ